MPRLRFFPVPARSRPNTPNPLKLAQSVGEVGVEFGRAGTTKDAVAAVVLSVRVLGAYVLLVGLTDVGLKAQVVFVGKVPVHDPFDASVAFRIGADEPLADEYGRPYYSVEDPTRVRFAAERVA